METKGGKIATLLFMIAVLIYTVINYLNGRAEPLLLIFALFLFLTTGLRIFASLIDDFKKK
jgi:hypothetical protein